MNKIIKITIISIFSVIILTGCRNNKEEKEEIENKNETEQIIAKDYTFLDTKLIEEDSKKYIQTTIKNNAEEELKVGQVFIYVYLSNDDNSLGKMLQTIIIDVNETIKKEESLTIKGEFNKDVSNNLVFECSMGGEVKIYE
jgi:uncharacterized protein YcfL